MEGHVVSVSRVIDAPAAALFAVVADAGRHPEIDGSGALVKLKDGPGLPHQLSLGSTFGGFLRVAIGVNALLYFSIFALAGYLIDRRLSR